jgi:hypothetical protein
MKFPDQTPTPLQALAIVKYPVTSWWGLYPQYYQPDMSQIVKAGIESFVDQGRANESSIKDKHRTWFERTFSVDFNIIDYEMASRSPTAMKMIWSWWPNIGFEPRYGGDIAFGAFATDGYLTFNATYRSTMQILDQIDTLTGNDTSSLPENATAMYSASRRLLITAAENYDLGWYPIATSQAEDAKVQAEKALTYVEAVVPLRQINKLLTAIVAITFAVLVLSNAYWYRKRSQLIRASKRGRMHPRQRRKQEISKK